MLAWRPGLRWFRGEARVGPLSLAKASRLPGSTSRWGTFPAVSPEQHKGATATTEGWARRGHPLAGPPLGHGPVGEPTRLPAADTLAARAQLGRRWQEAGWAGASTSPDPTPAPPLKTEAQGGGLDRAEVSQLARGHLGLQCPSPDSRIVSVSARARTPEASPPSERPSVWHLLACPPLPPPCCQQSDSLGGPMGNPPRLHPGSASPSSWARSGCTSRGCPHRTAASEPPQGWGPRGPFRCQPHAGVQCGSPHPGVSAQGPPGTPGACKGGCRWQGAGQSSHQTDTSEELASCHLCGPLPQLRPQRQGLVAESSSEVT